jgi:hypothetical protein
MVGADLTGANLRGARMVRTDLRRAALVECHVFGAAAWEVALEGASQRDIVITPEELPQIRVGDLEAAQFVYLLINHANVKKVFDETTRRLVLLLGRFGGGGLELLRRLAEGLKEREYLPVIFDFERSENRTFTETVVTLAGMSKFVVAELGGPSVPHELAFVLPRMAVPVVTLARVDAPPYSMLGDLAVYPWLIHPPFKYAGEDDLLGRLGEVVGLAEERFLKVRELKGL